MRIGLFVPFLSPAADAAYLRETGEVAEALGFHSLWAAEHVVLFDEHESKYPYSPTGVFPVNGENHILETFTSLAFLASVTERIRLGTGICLVPQRNPVYTAKEAANVDWLSGGRLDFGVGVGWLAEEFDAVATPFDRRGARCRSYLEVIRRLWCDEVSAYQDEFYTLPACRQYPKPLQDPHPPIHFGGESDAALRRTADLGQGWYGFNLDPGEVEPRLERLDALLTERGRTRADLEISISPYLKGIDREKLARYDALGVDQVIVPAFAGKTSEIRPIFEEIAQQLL